VRAEDPASMSWTAWRRLRRWIRIELPDECRGPAIGQLAEAIGRRSARSGQAVGSGLGAVPQVKETGQAARLNTSESCRMAFLD
jgi:hypothetical protein